MKKCIGIISYLPDDLELRTARLEAFKVQIQKMDEVLNLPVIIIAQNYTEEDKKIFSENCIVYEYDKLGVTKARKVVRRKLLESEYDMYILLDDDEIITSDHLATAYLDFIDAHPNCYINYFMIYLRGVAISRYILEQVPFAAINAQKLEGWDDAITHFVIQKLFPDKCVQFSEEAVKDLGLEIDLSNQTFPSSWKEKLSAACFNHLERNTLYLRQKIKNDPNFKIPEEWFNED